MTLDLDPGAYPVFIDGNYLNREADEQGDLVVSSASSLKHRLYDMDPAAIWRGTTASDLSDETVTFGLWEPGMQTEKDVDFIALLNHNLASFHLDLSDDNGATFPTSYSLTGQTADYYIKNMASTVAADKLRVRAHTTQTANDYKEIGTIIVGEALLQAAVPLAIYKQHPTRVKERSATMFDGSRRRNFIYRSDASIGFWSALCGFKGLTEAQANSLETILLGYKPFIFGPRPGDLPSFWKLCQVVPGSYTRDYMHLSTSGGLAVTFELEEIGGA